MKKRHSALLGLAVASLLAGSGLAGSGTAVAATPQPDAGSSAFASAARLATAGHEVAKQHGTHLRFLTFDHMLPARGTMHLRGQVIGRYKGQQGALAGATVKIYRQFNADSPWVYIGAQRTGNGAFPQFSFATLARMNARYKVVYAGDANFRGSQDVTWLSVYRLFHGAITDGARSATLHGNVDPFYNHRIIYLQKRACASCDYVTVRRATTGMAGAYSFDLPAPAQGRWWWRVAVPGTGAFIASRGGTFTTQLR